MPLVHLVGAIIRNTPVRPGNRLVDGKKGMGRCIRSRLPPESPGAPQFRTALGGFLNEVEEVYPPNIFLAANVRYVRPIFRAAIFLCNNRQLGIVLKGE